ncbi:methyltransferase domain-containing protein [Iocasia frigidifontis]|uniref:Methyltransferase domain-containing protein n=1 Tax=Iocasia fonsfrigidae TaxID=2682810 RepID=A0A8A7K7Z3_9FIRM|nr:class I SAM-dependent methyltransferase [Iocasia fonsfrigidae]QTL97846.1 methyltransferase domain-containing protein [Iocasia fonsfrigidae]
MGNDLWSSKIQGPLTLDLSREIRFRNDRKELLLDLLGLENGMTIVDVGCGPGALTRKLSSWLSEKTHIIGIDRDVEFIKYAAEKANKYGYTNIKYREGDALIIPLKDNSVDACTSHTVIEHVPNKEFLSEQKRVCRKNGVVSVMFSAAKNAISTTPYMFPEQTAREKELWGIFDEAFKQVNKEHINRNLWVGFSKLPKLFEELDFKNIIVDGIAMPTVIDDDRNSVEEKLFIVNVREKQCLETLKIGIDLLKNNVNKKEVNELENLIKERFKKRKSIIKEKIKKWEVYIAFIYIVRGTVS